MLTKTVLVLATILGIFTVGSPSFAFFHYNGGTESDGDEHPPAPNLNAHYLRIEDANGDFYLFTKEEVTGRSDRNQFLGNTKQSLEIRKCKAAMGLEECKKQPVLKSILLYEYDRGEARYPTRKNTSVGELLSAAISGTNDYTKNHGFSPEQVSEIKKSLMEKHLSKDEVSILLSPRGRTIGGSPAEQNLRSQIRDKRAEIDKSKAELSQLEKLAKLGKDVADRISSLKTEMVQAGEDISKLSTELEMESDKIRLHDDEVRANDKNRDQVTNKLIKIGNGSGEWLAAGGDTEIIVSGNKALTPDGEVVSLSDEQLNQIKLLKVFIPQAEGEKSAP